MRNEIYPNKSDFNKAMLWENTFMKKQIDRRKHQKDESFTIEDHLRAMVYAMLSSGACWKRTQNSIDEETGRITTVDKVFFNYDTEQLQKISPKDLKKKLKEEHLASRYTKRQMPALLEKNIEKLIRFQNENNGIDNYYKQFIEQDNSFKSLITALSNSNSKDKMAQLGIPLTCEYLRNVGYDLPKPDRHLCRLLGSEYLGLSDEKEADPFEVLDIVNDIAKQSKKSTAEIDYILWSYCASGYGEICTKKINKCKICKFKEFCNNNPENK